NFVDALGDRLPRRELAHVLLGHLLAVAIAQHALQHDADRDRESRDLAQARFLERRKRVERGAPAGRKRVRLAGVERVVGHSRLRRHFLGAAGCWRFLMLIVWPAAVVMSPGFMPGLHTPACLASTVVEASFMPMNGGS